MGEIFWSYSEIKLGFISNNELWPDSSSVRPYGNFLVDTGGSIEILKRLKSPVVIAQLVSIVASLIVTLVPEFQGTMDKIVYSITVIINVFAGVNNPTDQNNF